MDKKVIYIHGRGGDPSEADHYKKLFEGYDVIGLDYSSGFPWEAEEEFPQLLETITDHSENDILIANSIGAYFALNAFIGKRFDKTFFISPVTDMKKLIENMMRFAGVDERELLEKKEIKTSFGETLSWKYYKYAAEHRYSWNGPIYVLYGENDNLTSYETISSFCSTMNARLTVMKNGEHWFHTDEEMRFLDEWIKEIMKIS